VACKTDPLPAHGWSTFRWHRTTAIKWPSSVHAHRHGVGQWLTTWFSHFKCHLSSCSSLHVCHYKKAELPQRWPRDGAPYIWVPWKFLRVPEYAHGYFCQTFNGLLFRSILWMCRQNLKFVALPIPEIIRGTSKIWAVPGYTHAPFSAKFLMGFCSDGPCECIGQIAVL